MVLLLILLTLLVLSLVLLLLLLLLLVGIKSSLLEVLELMVGEIGDGVGETGLVGVSVVDASIITVSSRSLLKTSISIGKFESLRFLLLTFVLPPKILKIDDNLVLPVWLLMLLLLLSLLL